MGQPPDIVTAVPRLPARPRAAHKGTFGRVLVIGGSRRMPGGAVLSAMSALRGGAGLVRLAIVEGMAAVAAMHDPCYTLIPLPEDTRGRIGRDALPLLEEAAAANDVVALGPGLDQGVWLSVLVRWLVETAAKPMVVDADALNALASRGYDIKQAPPRILTPHPGEMARLAGLSTQQVEADRETIALRYAAKNKVVLLLKGHATLVTDGRRLYRNTTGNPGMATGGSGDVLTGLIAALLGQGIAPFEAAQLGAHVHGRAGDLAAAVVGEAGLTAVELLKYIPDALRACTEGLAPGPGTTRP